MSYDNPWIVTIVGGIIVGAIIYIFFQRHDNKSSTPEVEQNQENSQSVSQVLNVQLPLLPQVSMNPQSIQGRPLSEIKERIKILFIDDNKFKQVKNLKKFGWQTTQIHNVDNLDIPEIRDSQIIFVDYKGVGKRSTDQGLGVVTSLKQRYGDKKWLIFYSAHPLPLNIYDKGPDSFLAKNSDSYEIEQKIIEGANYILK
jgi:hypothetical protein